jgi:hypothetical protein
VNRLSAFGLFWWDFVVGEDWRAAAGIALAIGLSALTVHVGAPAWWVLPILVAAVLASSIQRAISAQALMPSLHSHEHPAWPPPRA